MLYILLLIIMTNNNFIIKGSRVLKKVVTNVAILPNSSILTFTSRENVHKLWPGIQLWQQTNRNTIYSFVYSLTGGVPYDGSAVDDVHHNHIAMVTIYSTLTTAGLIYTLVCLVFNIRFRNSKYGLGNLKHIYLQAPIIVPLYFWYKAIITV